MTSSSFNLLSGATPFTTELASYQFEITSE